jgi:membrane associated rhomboid family serine protease/Zn-finger nucleic acid-binding protein
MRRIVSGKKEIDICIACGAAWFDFDEIRELTEGRLPAVEGKGKEEETSGNPQAVASQKKEKFAALSRVRAAAFSSRCPRCEGKLSAIDFQATGIPVLYCPACDGILAPRESVAHIQAKFRFLREHGKQYAALGETLADETRRRMQTSYGLSGMDSREGAPIPLPIVVPLAADAPQTGPAPLAGYSIILVMLVLYTIGQVKGAPLTLPGGLRGLPSGTGFAGVPKLPLLFAPFFHAGFLPLAVGSLFLFVLGDNVEGRLGRFPFVGLFLLCGIGAGAAHVIWGNAGGPYAQGSTGAVAGVLGAYLVFFPNVSISMYGMGRIVRLPAYLFACAWVIASFFLARDPGPVMEFLDPGALSLAGNMAGFGTGVFAAILWRFIEDSATSVIQP